MRELILPVLWVWSDDRCVGTQQWHVARTGPNHPGPNHPANEMVVGANCNNRTLVSRIGFQLNDGAAFAGEVTEYGAPDVRHIQDGEWHHIVAVRDTNQIHIYLDGIKTSEPVNYERDFISRPKGV